MWWGLIFGLLFAAPVIEAVEDWRLQRVRAGHGALVAGHPWELAWHRTCEIPDVSSFDLE
jgi:hypothetical protein